MIENKTAALQGGSLEKKPDTDSIADQRRTFQGQFPINAILAFHRLSFGLIDGEIMLKILIKEGQFFDVEAKRVCHA